MHCEPHGHVTWSEFHYVVDDYGGKNFISQQYYCSVLGILCNPSNHFLLGNYADIFFELLDDWNLLQDPNANNPVVIRLLSAFY